MANIKMNITTEDKTGDATLTMEVTSDKATIMRMYQQVHDALVKSEIELAESEAGG